MSAIRKLWIGTETECPICGEPCTTAYWDKDMKLEFCSECYEHVVRADDELNRESGGAWRSEPQ